MDRRGVPLTASGSSFSPTRGRRGLSCDRDSRAELLPKWLSRPAFGNDLSPSGDLLVYITPGAAHSQAHIVSADSFHEIKSFPLPILYNQVVDFRLITRVSFTLP